MSELMHYGVGHLDGGNSGRFPWGSGEDPYQRALNFKKEVEKLKSEGLSETQIAEAFGMKTPELRAKLTISKDEIKSNDIRRVRAMSEAGNSNVAIAKVLGISEGTVRNYLKPGEELKREATRNIADKLKSIVDEKTYVDVGLGVERELTDAFNMGVSQDRLKVAIEMLKTEGYQTFPIKIEQLGTGKFTTLSVLAPPGTTMSEVYQNKDKIQPAMTYSIDNGKTWLNIEPPKNLDSSRIFIRYAEDGGLDRDGTIELRRGVDDISLGSSNYAQVRIAVDGTHYLKGMAIYSDDVPDGYDVIVNSNKPRGTIIKPTEKGQEGVFKKLKDDPDNPFGATISRQNGVINIVNEEGTWAKWSKILPSQMLSKQPRSLIEKQLSLSLAEKQEEYDAIMSYTLPAVKKKLLQEFADNCDAAAVNLKAAGLPRQQSHVLIPFMELKDNEIYAPNYKDGEHVVLIRYPHQGIFEIPELVVNNKIKKCKDVLGDAPDAVGINHNVAMRLSGADFDGDSVTVIPVNNRVRIKTEKYLTGLQDFDPGIYKLPDNAPRMASQTKQTQMGIVSNLITDMTLQGAPSPEMERAVRHAMVVIDAEKHHLDYQQSEKDNRIADLKEKYQSGGGAATIISRAKSQYVVPERREKVDIDPETGEKIYYNTNRTYIDPIKNKDTNETTYVYKKVNKETGDVSYVESTVNKTTGEKTKVVKTQWDPKYKEHTAQEESTWMAEAKDAYELVSERRHPTEILYANYANGLKSLANTARKESLSIKNIEVSKSAKQTYAAEVSSLDAKLNDALKNAPRERAAQIVANAIVAEKKESNPDMDKDTLKKTKNQALASAREKVGAHKQDVLINITDKEWDAIQSGAVSQSKVMQILNNTDMDKIKERATPRGTGPIKLTASETNRIKNMQNSGYTQAEIADALNISTSTVSKCLRGEL